jgi:hypothetical protein
MSSIRHVGDYQLTAHVTPSAGQFSAELLLSRSGGITLRRYRVPGDAFTDRNAAHDHAKRWMAVCEVSGDGRVCFDADCLDQRQRAVAAA